MTEFPYRTQAAFKEDFTRTWSAGYTYNGEHSAVPWETPFQIYENLKRNSLKMMVMGNFQFTGEINTLRNFGVSSSTPAESMWKALSEADTLADAHEHLQRAIQTFDFVKQTDIMCRFAALCHVVTAFTNAKASTPRVDASFKRYASEQLKKLNASTGTRAHHDANGWEARFREATGGDWSPVCGSILWDQNWTPGVNDAWLLGGIHNRFEFHYSDNSQANDGSAVSPKIGSKGQLYDEDRAIGQRLRVTGRELLGLFEFGYGRASVHKNRQGVELQTSFHVVNEGKWKTATFQRYNQMMTDLESDETRLVQRLREAKTHFFTSQA